MRLETTVPDHVTREMLSDYIRQALAHWGQNFQEDHPLHRGATDTVTTCITQISRRAA